MPCSDGGSCADEQVNIELTAANDDQHPSSHEHHDHGDDNCTPFCACACCGTVVLISLSNQEVNLKVDQVLRYTLHFRDDYIFNYQTAVWHPPNYS